MGFLPSSVCIITIVSMNLLDSNKTQGEKVRRDPHKNVTYRLKQTLDVSLHKIAAVRQFTF